MKWQIEREKQSIHCRIWRLCIIIAVTLTQSERGEQSPILKIENKVTELANAEGKGPETV